MRQVLLVTGLSGAGKASILRALEDLGYDAIDNPPLTLVPTVIGDGNRPVAIGLDARSWGFDATKVIATVDKLRARPGIRTRLLYAWAEIPVLLRRFTETRRRHPLAPQGRVADGIELERQSTLPLRDAADEVVDTTELSLPALRQWVAERFSLAAHAETPVGMTVNLMSFAFPAGLPREADMVFDARFLRNPHYDPILRSETGQNPQVAAFIEADPAFTPFFDQVHGLLRLVLPRFVHEGKKYATLAIGCTGGRHRSVLMVERLAPLLTSQGAGPAGWNVSVVHRELRAAARRIDVGAEAGSRKV